MSENTLVYNELRLKQQLCDAVIRVHGAEFPVHKVILCNCSPYFMALFSHWSTPDFQTVDIPGLSVDTMKVIIEFAYTGSVSVTHDNVQELFIAADHFNVTDILQACSDFMVEHLTPQNCVALWLFTDMFYYPKLRDKAFLFTLIHFEESVTTSEDFLQLTAQQLHELTENDQLNVKQEEKVYEAVLKWICHAPEERKEYMCMLLSNVRLALISPRYIIENVVENKLVKSFPEYRRTALKTLNSILDHMSKTFSISMLCHSLVRPRLPHVILLAVGGWSEGNPTNAIEAYDPRTDLWSRVIHTEETPWAYHGTVFLDRSIYCVGGFDSIEHFSRMHRFDLSTCTWHEASPMHSSRCFVSVTVMDGYIYAMGGFNGLERLESAERYEPRTNQWTLIAPMHEQRSDAGCGSFNGRVYICGGFNGNEYLSTAECYNPNTDQWTVISSMNSRRSGIGVTIYGNQIFAVGGFDGTNRLASAEAYDPSTNTWRRIPSMRIGRSNFGLSVIDDRLFVVGGFDGSTTIFNVEFYDVKTNQWSDASSMSVCRSALSCCVVHSPSNVTEHDIPPFQRFLQSPQEEEEEIEG